MLCPNCYIDWDGCGVCPDCSDDQAEKEFIELKKLVFISHPYRSDPAGNLAQATEICRRITTEYPDVVPVSPLHMFSFLTEDNRAVIMEYCRRLIETCDEVWLAPGWVTSEGCRQEERWAREMGKRVRFYT